MTFYMRLERVEKGKDSFSSHHHFSNLQRECWKDFLEVSSGFEGEKEIELRLLGYGRQTDFEDVNLTGKLAAFFSGDPESSESTVYL